MKKIIPRVLIVSGLVLASGAFAVSSVAARHNNNTRPGWGFGDRNHVHTGPPGQSVRVNNRNDVDVNVRNNQRATSGSASSSNNANGGTARSGGVSNSSSSNVDVNVRQ